MTFSFNTIVTDVDGVFTNGSFLYSKDGKEYKTFGPHDSDGIKIIKKYLNINVVAISADRRGFEITKRRMEDMGLYVDLVSEKDRYSYIQENYGIGNVAFVGDGIHDAACLKHSALGFVPANAPDFVKLYGDVVLNTTGGNGVFLEIALYLLQRAPNEIQEQFMKDMNL